jgi:hypothetical protein
MIARIAGDVAGFNPNDPREARSRILQNRRDLAGTELGDATDARRDLGNTCRANRQNMMCCAQSINALSWKAVVLRLLCFPLQRAIEGVIEG